MATEIKYNGNKIADLENGKAAILNCENKRMADDIVIVVNEPATEVVPEYEGDITISGRVMMINFTVAGTSYEAEDGMTWAEWCDSSYNTGGFVRHDGSVSLGGVFVRSGQGTVDLNDIIQADYAYGLMAGSGN